jgi:hypothetical protein
MSNGKADASFETTKYERDREHELKLNEFTHNLEMEQLKLLILLNGGAATALLAFAEKAASGPGLCLLAIPIALWLAGLGVGAYATILMREAQSLFGKSYRHRRTAVEAVHNAASATFKPTDREKKWLAEFERFEKTAKSSTPESRGPQAAASDAPRATAQPSDTPVKPEDGVNHARMADAALHCAGTRNDRVKWTSLASVGLFILGAAAAAAILILAPSVMAGSEPIARIEAAFR